MQLRIRRAGEFWAGLAVRGQAQGRGEGVGCGALRHPEASAGLKATLIQLFMDPRAEARGFCRRPADAGPTYVTDTGRRTAILLRILGEEGGR